MKNLFVKILCTILFILLSGCQTVTQKIDQTTELEKKELSKWLNKSENKSDDGEIIHKGISQRQFARSFTIAEDVRVNGAELKDGLLTISCEKIIPEIKKKRLIEIK